jgi:hypothetical protein
MGTTTTRSSETADTTADTVVRAAERMRDELDVTERWVRELVRGYPITCFLAAVASGYLIGRVARRI